MNVIDAVISPRFWDLHLSGRSVVPTFASKRRNKTKTCVFLVLLFIVFVFH